MRFAAEFDVLTESVVPGGDAEARKHFLALHFLCSFQVLDGFVDGFNQRAASGRGSLAEPSDAIARAATFSKSARPRICLICFSSNPSSR